MRILVIGAGIIGSVHGWALSSAGHDVEHLVRRNRAERLKDGIPVDIIDKRKGHPRRFKGVYKIRPIEVIEEPDTYEFVIFPGHHYTIDEVLWDLAPRFRSSGFLFMTQNWKGCADIDAVIPRSRYVLGDAKAGGSWNGDMLVGAIRSVDIGPVGAEGETLARRVIACFESADIKAPYNKRMPEYLWVQFALNGALWPALIEAGGFPELFKNEKILGKGLAALRECLGLLEQRGVRLDEYPELRMYRSTSNLAIAFASLMSRVMFSLSEWARRCSAHALGDPAEPRAFFYDILNTADILGYAMPVFSSYRSVIDAFFKAGYTHRP